MRNPPRKLELFYCVLVPYSWLTFEATFLRGGGKGDIEHEDIMESQSIQTAAEKAKFSEEHTKYLLEKCSTKEVKKKLRETTNTACRYGAFGLPTVVFHMHDKSHMFFGSDRMELLTHLLGEQWQGPVPNIMKGKLSAID